MLSAHELVRGILRLTRFEGPCSEASELARGLEARAEKDWTECLIRLDEHRLSPLAFFTLRSHSLLEHLPEPQRRYLEYRYQSARAQNQLALLTLRGISREFEAGRLRGIVFKGAHLCSEYYPDRATREMLDVDLLVSADVAPQARKAFVDLGFTRSTERSGPQADCFVNQLGVAFDVHYRMELFEHCQIATRPVPALSPEGSLHGFEPNALIAHLIAHLSEHAREIGPVLGWLLDVGFVLRKHAGELDAGQLRELLRAREHRLALLRTIAFLEKDWGDVAPPGLAAQIRAVRPFEFDSLLRQRRMASWGLPGPRGFARLAACGLGQREREGRHYPSWRDLLFWPADQATGLLERSRASLRDW